MGIRNHPEYERGYSDGYNTGYNRALESQVDAAQRSSRPTITLAAPTKVVNTARSTLAQKVLTCVEAEQLHENLDNESDKGYMLAINHVSAALRELFKREGVEIGDVTPES